MNNRLLPALCLLAAGCGPNAELIRYYVDVELLDVPPTLTPASAGIIYEVPPCTNAEVFDQSIRVYDGWVEGAVTAWTITWTGFELSGSGGENTETIFLREGDTHTVVGALKPDELLYDLDHKGRMVPVDDGAKVKRKSKAEGDYVLGAGAGITITEVHEVSKERDLVQFIDQGTWNCEATQF